MRTFRKVWLIRDEEYGYERSIAEQVENMLKAAKLNTYNHEYVVTLTVDEVDEKEEVDEEEE